MKTRGILMMTLAAGMLLAGGFASAQSRTVTNDRRAVTARPAEPSRQSRASEPSRKVENRRAPQPDRKIRPDRAAEPSRIVRKNDIRMFDQKHRIVLPREQFRELWPVSDYAVKEITRARFDSDRMELVRSLILDDGVFFSDQVVTISKSFVFSSDRTEFLELVYESTIDKFNFYKAIITLTFSSDRNRIMNYAISKARHYDEEPDIAYVPSKADISDMVKALKETSFSSDRKKMAMLMAVSQQLDSRQIAQLANTFTFESDKMEFLRNAYPFCITPREYDAVLKSLKFESDRRSLMDEIRRMTPVPAPAPSRR